MRDDFLVLAIINYVFFLYSKCYGVERGRFLLVFFGNRGAMSERANRDFPWVI